MSSRIARTLSAALLAASVLAACRSPDKFVLFGQRYDAVDDCVEPMSSIDIVEGSDPGIGCAPQCVLTPSGVLFVTTECGGNFPTLDEVTAEDAGDPICEAAVKALTNMVVCGAGDDGGDDATDAASEGGSVDAPPEAGPEAGPDVVIEASE